MIVSREEMIALERGSGYTGSELMERAGQAVWEDLIRDLVPGSRVLILAGKGNNGGDGFVLARLLSREPRTGLTAPDHQVRVWLAEGLPASREAEEAFARMDPGLVLNLPERPEHTGMTFEQALARADLVIDAVYGFSYHGPLREPVRSLFRQVNASGIPVRSIDLNSGSEADSGYADPDALRSRVTWALECRKPVHQMNRTLGLAQEIRVLDLGIRKDQEQTAETPAFAGSRPEMDEKVFFSLFPERKANDWKGSRGKVLLIAGSYGMAGAACLNILGAKTVGAGYLQAALPDSIYSIAAGRFLTPVYYPFTEENAVAAIRGLLRDARTVCFGSGAVRMPRKREILQLVLESGVPAVLDAEALNLLSEREDGSLLKTLPQDGSVKAETAAGPAPVRVLTPHIGEFSHLTGLSTEEIRQRPVKAAEQYAADHRVILVLKGADTIVASPEGRIYINQSGSPALAQAGSGDLLAGMTAAMMSLVPDAFTAVCMAVWLHGRLAEPEISGHSVQCLPLETFPEIMDRVLREQGR